MNVRRTGAARIGAVAAASIVAVVALSACSADSGDDLGAQLKAAEQATADALASHGAALRAESEALELKRRSERAGRNCVIEGEIAESMGKEPKPCGYTGPTEPPAPPAGAREYSTQELMTLMCATRAEVDATKDAKPREIVDVVEVAGSEDTGAATAQVVYTEEGTDGQQMVAVSFRYLDGTWRSCDTTSQPKPYN